MALRLGVLATAPGVGRTPLALELRRSLALQLRLPTALDFFEPGDLVLHRREESTTFGERNLDCPLLRLQTARGGRERQRRSVSRSRATSARSLHDPLLPTTRRLARGPSADQGVVSGSSIPVSGIVDPSSIVIVPSVVI